MATVLKCGLKKDKKCCFYLINISPSLSCYSGFLVFIISDDKTGFNKSDLSLPIFKLSKNDNMNYICRYMLAFLITLNTIQKIEKS